MANIPKQIADGSNYGKVKLVDELQANDSRGVNSGVAVTPKVVNDVKAIAEQAAADASTKAPSYHTHSVSDLSEFSKSNSDIVSEGKTLTVGDANRKKYESDVSSSGIYGSIDGLSTSGQIGVFGGSDTSGISGSTVKYPIGVMGLGRADNANNTSTVGAGYFHNIRYVGTTGASVGVEIDNDIRVQSQDINPNASPDPAKNFSCALALSSGGGDHNKNNKNGAKDLSTAIQINKNPTQFKHAINIGRDALSTTEAITMPSDIAKITWYSNPEKNSQVNPVRTVDREIVSCYGRDDTDWGSFVIKLHDPNASDGYAKKVIGVNTNLNTPEMAILNISAKDYIKATNTTIDLSSYLTETIGNQERHYKLIGICNLQPDNMQPNGVLTKLIIASFNDNSFTVWNAGESVTTGLHPVIVRILYETIYT